ncbi:MAG: polymer-forming cytoskeletal protein [Mariprofundaceae bacterium]
MKFGSKTTSSEDASTLDSLIGQRSSFKGELAFDGTVRIDGTFEGNIRSPKDGTLIVSESASITGEVDVPNLVLHGNIRGNVRASKHLQIGPQGCLTGDVEYLVINLTEGGTVNGRCIRINEAQKQQAAVSQTAPDRSNPSGEASKSKA